MKKAKKSMKRKMLVPICGILIGVLVLTGVITYRYFWDVLKEKGISDDQKNLEQAGQQINYVGEELEYFTRMLLMDEEIQQYITTQYYEDAFDEVFTVLQIRERLTWYTFMREDVKDILLNMPDKDVIWSMEKDKDRSAMEVQTEWYREFKEEKQSGFSKSHKNALNEGNEYISYVYPFVSYYMPKRPLGDLIVDIDRKSFDDILNLTAKEYDAFYWILDDKDILYRQDETGKEVNISDVVTEENEISKCYVLNEKDGYWIIYQIPKYGWKLVAFTGNERISDRLGYLKSFFLASIFLGILLVLIVMVPMISKIAKPIQDLSEEMNKVSKGDFQAHFQADNYVELTVMSNSFNYMVSELNAYIKRIERTEAARFEMEEKLLLSQVNPHFIYNVLNTVIFLARKGKNQEVVEVTDSFIHLLRDAVRPGKADMFATISQEIDILEHYLKIQEYRYQDAYQVILDVEEETLQVPVPRTILQPLVENAIIHGILSDEKETGIVRVHIKDCQDHILMEVEDNGTGMEEKRMQAFQMGVKMDGGDSKMKSIGIPNILSRLRYLYGDRAHFIMSKSEMGGVLIHIEIPK